jgi:divalent metal cation (Fe/Co/Zn/Cd) transporter
MEAQFRLRTVRLFSSFVVQAALTVAAVSQDFVVASFADAVGSVFVAGVIVVNAINMLRSGLPDLLDRAATEDARIAINQALARHVDDYQRLDRVRSRRSGDVVFVEVALGFDEGLSMAEVERRIDALKSTILGGIGHADISILASSHAAPTACFDAPGATAAALSRDIAR